MVTGIPGFYTIHATSRDTSNNTVSSELLRLRSSRFLSSNASISAPNEIAKADITLSSDGSINEIIPREGFRGSAYEIEPDVRIVGKIGNAGEPAKVKAKLNQSGEIESFQILSREWVYLMQR